MSRRSLKATTIEAMSTTRTLKTALSQFVTGVAQFWEGYMQKPTAC